MTGQSIAQLFFLVFPALLGIDCALGHRPALKPLDADFLAGIDAIAVCAVIDGGDDLVDLVQQFAVPVAGTQLEEILGFT